MKNVRSTSFIIILSILLSLINSSEQSNAQEYVYQEDFEDGQAQDWSLEPGWKVILEGDNHVLSGEGHVWARSNQSFSTDYRLSFRLKLQEGNIHLIYRLNDIGRYYIGFHMGGSYLSKQYWPDEFYEDLIDSHTQHSLNTWHKIEIIGQGETLKFVVDGTQEWVYIDPQPLQNGSFALETLEDSSAFVDNILVETESTISPTSTPSMELNSTWTRLGGPLGGLGYDIRMQPDNPDVMFVTDAWAGVFTSHDGGHTWLPSNDGITTRTGPSGDAIPVFSLTIDPNDPEIIWIGTQFTRGIFKSTNGGMNWQKMDNGVVERDGITFRGFTVDPNNSDIVYAAAELSSWAWSTDSREHMGREFDLTAGVIYKTVDGGQSWKPVWRGDNLARYIWINPQDTNIIYISTGIFDREAANSDPQADIPGGEGVLKSTDGGLTWVQVNSGLNNLYVGSLFMHPTNPEILLAGTGNNQYNDEAGIYITRDGGNSWKQILPVNDAVTAVEIATSDPNIAYAGGRFSVFRSEDGGLSWQRVSGGESPWGAPGVQTGFPIDFQVDPRNPDRIFTNAYGGGAFLSEDGGKTWQDASKGYTGAQVRDISVDPTAPGRVIVAARSGVFASYDGGEHWSGINPANIDSIEWNAIAIDPSDPQHLIGSINVGGLLVNSRNGGKTWQVTLSAQSEGIGWHTIAFAPSDPKVIYAGSTGFRSAGSFSPLLAGKGIFVSRDGGMHWLQANDSNTQDANVYALTVHPSDPNVVYAATANHGLLKTSDGGSSWTVIQNGLPSSFFFLSTAISSLDANRIFLGLDRGAAYYSTNSGQSWNHSEAGLNPEASVTDIVFDPANPETLYLADSFSGIYRSTDAGKTWTAINSGLLAHAVNALALSSDGTHLYAAIEGSGVYRLDVYGVPPQPVQVIPTSQPTHTPSPGLTATTPTTGSSPVVPSSPTPTTTPAAKPGICGAIVLLPILLTGMVWWISTRKRSPS